MLSTINQTQLRMRLRTSGVTTTLASPSGTLQTGVWTHIAMTYNGTRMALYKNGNEVAFTPKTGLVEANPSVNAAIGNQPLAAGAGRAFDGMIDDVRIYDRALSATELGIIVAAPEMVNAAPEVAIISPATDAFSSETSVVNFSVSASDAEDGDVAASARWTSSLQGFLGTGSGLETDELLPGLHRIAVTVNDSAGTTALAATDLWVRPGYYQWTYLRGFPFQHSGDFDFDGHSLLLEYGFGLNPAQSDPVPCKFNVDDSQVPAFAVLRFPVPKEATDLIYIVQSSANLIEWKDLSYYVVGSEGLERVILPDGVSAGVESGGYETDGNVWQVTEQIPVQATTTASFYRISLDR
jgi:hypothetical protein